ncbi:MAG: universal stress protein [Haloarculaceae archaeon]
MYERILLPTDGSAGMRRVIDHAADLAAAHDALIHALYVVDSGSYASLPMETAWDGIAGMLREEGETALAAVERVVGERAPVETATVDGSPSRDIVSYAREQDCDLVVMGTHGRGGIDRLLIGSVAERVVRTSDVPVMTVRVHPGDGDGVRDPAEDATGPEATPEPGAE